MKPLEMKPAHAHTAPMTWTVVRALANALLVVAATSGCTKKNPAYCNTSLDCSNGDVCDVSTHACVAGVDAMQPTHDAAPPECDVNKPFAPFAEIPVLHDPMANDVHGTLTADELTIYFATNRSGYSTTMGLYRASRPTRDAPFQQPILAPFLAGPSNATNPAISSDGLTIFFDTGTTLMMSKRSDVTVAFPAATTVSSSSLAEPSITADGQTLYASNLGTGFLARLTNVGGTFGPAQDVDTQLAYTQVSPATRDDLTLYLTLRNGAVHVTKRNSTTEPWPTPTAVTELNTHDEEVLPSWVSSDGCRLYMTYTPTGNKSRLVMAARPK
jgi:hypothetical protein